MKKDYDSTRIYRNTQKKGASQTYDTPSSFFISITAPFLYLLLIPSRFLIRHIHSYQDAGGTRQEIGGNLLAKHPWGENHRRYRVEIDPVGSLYRAQFWDAPVPREEADHRGKAAQKKQIAEYLRTGEYLERRKTRDEDIIRQDGKQYSVNSYVIDWKWES